MLTTMVGTARYKSWTTTSTTASSERRKRPPSRGVAGPVGGVDADAVVVILRCVCFVRAIGKDAERVGGVDDAEEKPI